MKFVSPGLPRANSPFYWTVYVIEFCQKNRKGNGRMFSMEYVHGHVQVYDRQGRFLFSADTEQEAREEMEELAESAA